MAILPQAGWPAQDGLKEEEEGDFKDDHQIFGFSSQSVEVPFSELGKCKGEPDWGG